MPEDRWLVQAFLRGLAAHVKRAKESKCTQSMREIESLMAIKVPAQFSSDRSLEHKYSLSASQAQHVRASFRLAW